MGLITDLLKLPVALKEERNLVRLEHFLYSELEVKFCGGGNRGEQKGADKAENLIPYEN